MQRGQLGTGSTIDVGDTAGQMGEALTPVSFPSYVKNMRVIDVTAGRQSACALFSDNTTVYCWGSGANGVLGNGMTLDIDSSDEFAERLNFTDIIQPPRPEPAYMRSKLHVKEVSMGASHACAVLSDGTVRCWGSNSVSDGAARILLDASQSPTHARVTHPLARPFQSLPFFPFLSVLQYGQLGQNTYSMTLGHLAAGVTAMDPVNLGKRVNVTKVCAGGSHSCALTADGRVMCWGKGMEGQLGTGSMSSIGTGMTIDMPPAPAALSTNYTVLDLSCGGDHTCFLMRPIVGGPKAVKCVGSNAVSTARLEGVS